MRPLKYYLKKGEKEKWALGQFNFSNSEVLKSIIQAAKKQNSPIIVGISERKSKLVGLKQTVTLLNSCKKELRLPIFLNLDHAKSFDYIKKAVETGFQAVHFDGSELPLGKNIKITKKVVKYAHKKNVLVEGEIDTIGGALTDPAKAQKFVKETKVDNLAVDIGNIHGIIKSGKNPRLSLQRLRKIKRKSGRASLVLHGGSGTVEEDIKAAIRLGIVKININTDLKRAYKKAGIKAVERAVKEKIKLFGSVNKI